MVIEITAEDQARLAHMANEMQRPMADLAREAMHWFVAPREEHSEIIERSRRQIEDGKTIDHEALFAEIDRLLNE